MSERDLEHALSAALRELPAPQAPATLLPRVMASVRTRERRPWYARPFSTWSPLHQVCGVTTCLVLVIAMFTFAMPVLGAATTRLDVHAAPLAQLIDAIRDTQHLVSVVTALASAVAALWPRLCGPLVGYAVVLLLLLGTVLGALSSTLNHFTQQEV